MIKRIKSVVLSLIASVAFLLPAAIPAVAHAATFDPSGGLNCGTNIELSETGTCATSGDGDATTKVNDAVRLALNLFSAVVGIIAVVMIIVGGIKYITSGGDSGNVTSAKNTILYAIVGIVVAFLAYAAVNFVMSSLNQSTT
jgi:type IV secretory pathway VirB2 component (pilin)